MSASAVGRRILGEIEEASLDEILTSVRAAVDRSVLDAQAAAGSSSSTAGGLKRFPIEPLNDLAVRQFRATQSVPVTLSGRPLPLIYVLLATLVSPPHSKAVVVIDLEGEFDIARVARCAPWREAADAALGHDIPPSSSPATSSASGAPSPCVADEDLAHIYVCLPPETSSETSAAAMVASTRDYMLYGAHESRAREWWGTIVVGGGAASSDVALTTAPNGWLRVEREPLPRFGAGLSAEMALELRERRRATVAANRWVASSAWGSFTFRC